MAAPGLEENLQPESIANFQTNVKKTATITGICDCSATWLESRAVINPNGIAPELNFSGGADCDGQAGCTKVDYSVLPELRLKSLKDFNPTAIECLSDVTLTLNLEKKRTIKYLSEKCILTIANAVLGLNTLNLQDSALPVAKLTVQDVILRNGTTVLEVDTTIKKKLNITCCGPRAFNISSNSYRSTLPVFSSFSNRFV